MIPFHRKIFILTLRSFDLLAVVCSLYLTAMQTIFKNHSSDQIIRLFLDSQNKGYQLFYFFAFLMTCHIIFRTSGFYLSKRISSYLRVILDIMKAVLWVCIILFAGNLVLSSEIITSRFIVYFFTTTILFISGGRLFMRCLLYLSRINGRNLRYVVVLGTNKRAIDLARTIIKKKELGFLISGFIDDPWSGLKQFKQTEFKLLGDLQNFREYLRNNIIDEVLVCLPIKSLYEESYEIVSVCEEHGVIVRFASNIFGLNEKKVRHEYIGTQSMITQYNTENIYDMINTSKRILDLFASAMLLLLFTPFFICIGVLIKVTSPGPIFYSQERVGLNKRLFKLYKFRSMVQNAEHLQKNLEGHNEVGGPVFKIKEDPRITPLGRFIRRTSIDELPQLFNVLKGEMSLVGPRPLPIRDFNGFEKDWHRRRFSVLPGLTCLWQINGRNNIEFDQWMALDLKYIDNRSLLLDFKILLLTIPAIIKRTGAS